MIDKKTVFILGAGASCPYGYPSGARLRERICLPQGFWQSYLPYLQKNESVLNISEKDIRQFIDAFAKSSIRSIDMFMANNPKLAPIGKYIIAFEIFKAEQLSHFGEEAKLTQEVVEDKHKGRVYDPRKFLSLPFFQGDDWYSYLYSRLIEGPVGPSALPNFSDGKLLFITFNYDRSLEQFFYEALRYSFTEVSEDKIIESLKQLKILHVYGQIAPLKWQNPSDYVDYKPQPNELLLQRVSNNIRTIYEEKQNPELTESQNLLKQADEIFFLGFGYAQENTEVLGLPKLIPPKCQVYGTAFNMIDEEINRLRAKLHGGRTRDEHTYLAPTDTRIDALDCLMLLRKYLR
jgi:hypothetical protein